MGKSPAGNRGCWYRAVTWHKVNTFEDLWNPSNWVVGPGCVWYPFSDLFLLHKVKRTRRPEWTWRLDCGNFMKFPLCKWDSFAEATEKPGGFRSLFRDQVVRKPLQMGVVLMALQQYCGINGLLGAKGIKPARNCRESLRTQIWSFEYLGMLELIRIYRQS